ncbi:U1 zinc finger-domain-containing protein [Syncephalis plumigaleata]|nr:U1 zinc finger-domain-containing protein [Syncephalis plumigaleata]
MPKYYCDYCDIFLTHDSASVRRAHNTGWKHAMHVRNYYADLTSDKVQAMLEKLIKAFHDTGAEPPPELLAPVSAFPPMSMSDLGPPPPGRGGYRGGRGGGGHSGGWRGRPGPYHPRPFMPHGGPPGHFNDGPPGRGGYGGGPPPYGHHGGRGGDFHGPPRGEFRGEFRGGHGPGGEFRGHPPPPPPHGGEFRGPPPPHGGDFRGPPPPHMNNGGDYRRPPPLGNDYHRGPPPSNEEGGGGGGRRY